MKSKIKGITQKLIDSTINMAFAIGNKIDKNIPNYILKSSLKCYENNTENNISFVYRPKATNRISCAKLECKSENKVGVILQGPVMETDNFTLETVKLYKRTMPESIIILSTWNNTSDEIISKFKKLNIEIVLSNYPVHTGIGNINYQIFSTMQGIRRAKALGVTHVMKTRTDQRMSQTNLVEYLDALLDSFLIEGELYKKRQKERIIALQGSVGGNMFIPYFIPDFFFYGNIDDISTFFSYPLQIVNETREERSKKIDELKRSTVWEYYYNTAPEIQITLNYLTRIGFSNLSISCESWWEIVKNLFIFISYDDVRFFWPKYDNHYDENFISMNFSNNDITGHKTYVWNYHNWFLVETGKIIYSHDCDDYIKEKATVI